MNEAVIQVIQNYIQDCLFEPGSNWPKYFFDERSYSRWAAYEILHRLMDKPFLDPIELVNEFMLTMDYYSCVNEGSKQSLIFMIAHDTAKDILCLLL